MVTSWKKVACLILSVWMLGNWANAVEPDVVIPLWPGDGLPPGAKAEDPQNQQPDDKGLIRRMDKPELRVFLQEVVQLNGFTFLELF